MDSCKICKNQTNNKIHHTREMLFGFKDKFKYLECSKCGCLQLLNIPQNLSQYYPKNYYSYQKPLINKNNFLKSLLRHQRAKFCLGKKNIIGFLITRMRSKPYFYSWFKGVNINLKSAVLDVGCGTGQLLLDMQKEGFSNLTGIDPFIQNDIFYNNGIIILKKELSEINKLFDFIMLNHTFEHMPQPLLVLKELYRLLKPHKYIMIRIPIASSFAWRKYGVNWVQLDAPRHFFLHTLKSIQILIDQVGFRTKEIMYDSDEFQFWGSEQYLKDIPLMDHRSYSVNPQDSIFSTEQIDSFKIKARELNKNKNGDSAYFLLYKT